MADAATRLPPRQRPWWLIGLMTTLLLSAVATVVWRQMTTAEVRRSTQDSDRTSALVRELLALRDQPRQAVFEADSTSAIVELVEAARAAAGLPTNSILAHETQPAARIGRSYEILPTRLQLAPAPLEQWIRFIHRLEDRDRGLTVRDLHLQESPAHPNAERWSGDLVICQLIYAPLNQ